MKKSKNLKKNQWATIIGAGILITVSVLAIWYYINQQGSNNLTLQNGQGTSATNTTIPQDSVKRIENQTEQSVIKSYNLEDQLLYLIEEEKLAHDVYLAMNNRYNVRPFGNILNSEVKHQDRVLTLLNDRGIGDPRSNQAGVFTNKDLQALYDQLVAQGNQNVTEAYKVGVAIEELDIADITAQLEQIDSAETDVITVLNELKNGSENHLKAFLRK